MNIKTIETTLEQYFLSQYPDRIDFHLRVECEPNGVTRFYIHPLDKDGETLDFCVAGNQVECLTQYLN